MDPRSVLAPVFAQVLLTFVVWVRMYSIRLPAIRRSGKSPQELADPAVADEVLKSSENASDNFMNLFELPVLFYVAVIVLFMTTMSDSLDLKLAWAFVGLRAIHSFVHCTSNRIAHRFAAYLLSSLVLWAIWVRIAARVLG